MRCHDFHLSGYEVLNFGNEIVFHLVYDYPPLPREENRIRFERVKLYHFVHTGGAIILDMEETSISRILDEYWDHIALWEGRHGGMLLGDGDDRASCQRQLEAEGCRAWHICSSIGFAGFVIANSIEESPNSPTRN